MPKITARKKDIADLERILEYSYEDYVNHLILGLPRDILAKFEEDIDDLHEILDIIESHRYSRSYPFSYIIICESKACFIAFTLGSIIQFPVATVTALRCLVIPLCFAALVDKLCHPFISGFFSSVLFQKQVCLQQHVHRVCSDC